MWKIYRQTDRYIDGQENGRQTKKCLKTLTWTFGSAELKGEAIRPINTTSNVTYV